MKLLISLVLILPPLFMIGLYQTSLAIWMCAHPVYQSAYWQTRFYVCSGVTMALLVSWFAAVWLLVRARSRATRGVSFRAEVQLVATESGGRGSSLRDGLPVFLCFADTDEDGFGFLYLDEQQEPLPGEKCMVRIDIPPTQWKSDVVRLKAVFTLKEGHQVVGRGLVLELLKAPSRTTPVFQTL